MVKVERKGIERSPTAREWKRQNKKCSKWWRDENRGNVVDGYDECDPTTNLPTVYEFYGCLWHGCPKCFPINRESHSIRATDKTLEEAYEYTMKKEETLRSKGYNLVTIWECEWDKQVKENNEPKTFIQECEILEPLNPRDAFYGGRTNAVKLHHEVKDKDEKVKYADVTSLYPWVNKTCEYPIGHPEIIVDPEDQDINNYFGMAKIDIEPPYELYHPVLPHRNQGKLTIPLCKACVEQEMPKNILDKSYRCNHTAEQRMLRGTWCTPEILKAVEVGYKISKIHEVWHFPPRQRMRGLFKKYVNTWLKIKQESAGYPSWADTPKKKRTYVEQYKEKEGISLDPEMIVKNPGRKATAKLMLNSFWGKFGENLHKAQTIAVYNAHNLFNLVSDPLADIKQVRICNEESLEVVCVDKKENEIDNGKVNIFIAAFTTCYARLKLYESLEKLQQQVLYFDTDSVIYSVKPGKPTYH